MGSFTDSLKQNIERVKQEIDTKITTYAQILFNTVVAYSPTQPEAKWAKGEFINSWYPASNSYDDTSVTGSYDYYGRDSLNRIRELSQSKTFFGKDGFVSLSNNVSYAAKVEYSGWYDGNQSTPPYAPVRKAINIVANNQGA